jgi:hypothetical protein
MEQFKRLSSLNKYKRTKRIGNSGEFSGVTSSVPLDHCDWRKIKYTF